MLGLFYPLLRRGASAPCNVCRDTLERRSYNKFRWDFPTLKRKRAIFSTTAILVIGRCLRYSEKFVFITKRIWQLAGMAHQQKLEKYEDLREQCTKNDWSTDIFPLEIGCRGFISNATSTFFTKIGLTPAKKREYIKKIQNKTVTASEQIWHSYRLNTIQ